MSCEGTAWGCHSQVRVCEYVWGGSLSPRPALRRLSSHRYFGFITKHPADHRFACHVFVSEESTKALAESVGYARVCVCVSCLAPALEQAPALGPRARPQSTPKRPPSPAGLVAASRGWVVLRGSSRPCWLVGPSFNCHLTQEVQRVESRAEQLRVGESEPCPGTPRLQLKNRGWRWCSSHHRWVSLFLGKHSSSSTSSSWSTRAPRRTSTWSSSAAPPSASPGPAGRARTAGC